MAEESKGQTITVEVAPNSASPDDVVELGVKVGQTAQSWLERLNERAAATAADQCAPQRMGRS